MQQVYRGGWCETSAEQHVNIYVNVCGLSVESVFLALMRYAAYLSLENTPASYGPFD